MTRAAPWIGIGLLLVAAGCASPPPPQEAPESAIALTGARLIDGTGQPAIADATVVIANGRIAAVGAADTVSIPTGTTRVDLAGKTIIPGLINAHAHLDNGDPALPMREQVLSQLRLYARYGVTTAYSLGDDGDASVQVRDEQSRGQIDGARLFVSGPGLTPATPDEAREAIDGHAATTVDIIKTRLEGAPTDMAPEVYRALIEHAHANGLRVAAHVFYRQDARNLIDAGVDVIAHSVRDQDVDDELAEALTSNRVAYIPTLTRDLSVFVYETTPDFLSDPFFLRGEDAYRSQMAQLRDPALQARTRASAQAQAIKPALAQASRNLKRLADAGVTIAMGTDSGTSLGRWQGYFEHVELALMVEAGLTPMQALVAATSGAALAMHLDDAGTLQTGQWADLLVLDADPLADIRNTRRIHSVWIAGRRFSAADAAP
jgi:imidazolonepropionase-like amidohydrolase